MTHLSHQYGTFNHWGNIGNFLSSHWLQEQTRNTYESTVYSGNDPCIFLDGKVVLTLGGEEVLLEYLEYGGGAAHQLLVALPHPVRQAARPVLYIKKYTKYGRRVIEIRRRALSFSVKRIRIVA
jgi:hypothetical protein